MATPEDFIDTFYRSIRDLHSVRKSLDNEYSAGLMKILQSAAKDISDHTGEFLHMLPEKKPDEDTLQNMISASPSSLNYKNDKDDLPIHTAMYHPDSIRYIPLLAREGVKHKVGGKDGRGGLLVVGSTIPVLIFKPLQSLVWMRSKDNPCRDLCDKAYLDAMKELKDCNLLTKEDIKNHSLFTCCCFQGCKQRFEFLCDWCPEGLKEIRPIIPVTQILSIESLAMLLKATTKRHYQEAGLLFQTDSLGITACQSAFDKYGKEETMQVIGNCIPFDNPQIPILHHVAKHAIHLLNDFVVRYRSAAYLRDEDGRNLDQAILASGNKTFASDGSYFLRMLSDDQVREIDPASDLYPFMVAASSETSDLSAVYVLLRRNPSLARGGNIR